MLGAIEDYDHERPIPFPGAASSREGRRPGGGGAGGEYESTIRRAVRIKLVDARLKGLLDSMDICQSVLGSFFYRAALGQYDLERPDDLVRLLVTMARNKLADQARRQSTERRGKGMIRVGDAAEIDVPGGDPTASRVASGRDVLLAAKEQLGADERWLAEEARQRAYVGRASGRDGHYSGSPPQEARPGPRPRRTQTGPGRHPTDMKGARAEEDIANHRRDFGRRRRQAC